MSKPLFMRVFEDETRDRIRQADDSAEASWAVGELRVSGNFSSLRDGYQRALVLLRDREILFRQFDWPWPILSEVIIIEGELTREAVEGAIRLWRDPALYKKPSFLP